MGKKKQKARPEPDRELTGAPPPPEALSGLATELEALWAGGDRVALADRAREALERESLDEGDQALARRTLQSLRLDPAALGFFLAGLCIWAVAFTLGIVLRHG